MKSCSFLKLVTILKLETALYTVWMCTAKIDHFVIKIQFSLVNVSAILNERFVTTFRDFNFGQTVKRVRIEFDSLT